MKETNVTPTWRQYEAGKDHKRRIGLYETVRRNERFYRGDQWRGSAADLPKPVFNLVKRITDYLICTVASSRYAIRYTDENLPFNGRSVSVRAVRRGLELLTGNARYRWERCKMDNLVYQLLLDAALSGDGALMCYWDPDAEGDGLFRGDICVQPVDSVNLFVSDVNRADIQSQDYIIVSGRASVASLRREAAENGLSATEIARIVADEDTDGLAGDLAASELCDGGDGKATYLIKFWREDGRVVFEKSVRHAVIRKTVTDLRLYPISYFNWMPAKNSFHGASPVSGMIPNQQYVNRAYAMVMKHMTDTAFSKVVYDKSRIPEWSNEVGEAIGVVGAVNVSDAVSVVGTGEMQAGYLDLINMAVSATKELAGATETALGNIDPTNTSAILALKETSRVTLEQVTMALSDCIESLALIWADMMCAYYADDRLIPFIDEAGHTAARSGIGALRDCLVRARVEVVEAASFGESAAVEILNKLLDGGHISAAEYVAHLPDGILRDRETLVSASRGGEIYE